jgi:hypothetical protein
VTERQTLGDAIGVGGVHDCGFAEPASAFRALGLAQVASAGAAAQDFAAAGDLEPLGHGLLGLNTFGASHKKSCFFPKNERAIYGKTPGMGKRYFVHESWCVCEEVGVSKFLFFCLTLTGFFSTQPEPP